MARERCSDATRSGRVLEWSSRVLPRSFWIAMAGGLVVLAVVKFGWFIRPLLVVPAGVFVGLSFGAWLVGWGASPS